MAPINRVTTWYDRDVLTAEALNDEFDNILTHMGTDSNGRITLTITPIYDLVSDVLATAFDADLGAVAVPNGKQINHLWLRGSLTSTDDTTDHYLNGITFDYTNDATTNAIGTDHNRVRAIIGTAATSGPGSVRAAHLHALGTGTATGVVNSINAQVTPVATTAVCRAVQITNTGVVDLVDAIYFAGTGATNRFHIGLNFEDAHFSLSALNLVSGTNNGRIRWDDASYITGLGGSILECSPNFKLGLSGTGRYLELWEMTAPAAPPTNSARLFCEDTGGGKTRLVVRFPTGVQQVLATEP